VSGRASELGNRKRLETETGASSPKTCKRSLTAILFQLTDGLVFIHVKLNRSGPLWMMLDTGSSVTVLDESVSMMLGVPFVDEGSVYGPGQGSGQRLVYGKHATLSFGEVELGDQTVASVPLGRFSCELGRGTDGFLGSNAFRNYVVEIDYSHQVLRLYDPVNYSYLGPSQRLPLQFVWNGIPTVRAEAVRSDGTAIEGTFLIDSGATTAVWLSRGFNDAHPGFLSSEKTMEVPSFAVIGGEESTRLGHVLAIRLGHFFVPMPATEF
jgi:aspartyl protease